MSLFFRNTTNSVLRVAIYFHDTRCGFHIIGERIILAAWYRLDPGQSRQLVSGTVGGSDFYYYAENTARTMTWSGNFTTDVPNNGHNGCWSRGVPGGVCSNCRRLGFRTISIPAGTVNYTINLIASSAQRNERRKNTHMALPTKRNLSRKSENGKRLTGSPRKK
ncbi:DUF1036 domain-containing protein [Paenibacillus methanolicus]|uniref:DUF1036 domain-containing protein n=1 Tax=Paenibacillus methanolicus TaxID=582686 RepID=UPI0011E6794F